MLGNCFADSLPLSNRADVSAYDNKFSEMYELAISKFDDTLTEFVFQVGKYKESAKKQFNVAQKNTILLKNFLVVNIVLSVDVAIYFKSQFCCPQIP